MRIYALLLTVFCCLSLVEAEVCSPLIQTEGLPSKLNDICTARILDNNVIIIFTAIGDSSNYACMGKTFTVRSVSWRLFTLSSVVEFLDDNIENFGLAKPGVVRFAVQIPNNVYGMTAHVELTDGSSIQQFIVNGYFVSGCTGTLGESTDQSCNSVFQMLTNLTGQNHDLQYCDLQKFTFGGSYCGEVKDITCLYPSTNFTKCFEADVMYGKKTETVDGTCFYSQNYLLLNKGVLTRSDCSARFQICTVPKVNGDWSSWTLWSTCDVTCGEGRQSRLRTCTDPTPQYGGQYCENPQFSTHIKMCFLPPCPINGEWSIWTSWTTCDVTCGTGNRSRQRTCSDPTPQYGGQDCENPGSTSQYEDCNEQNCPSNEVKQPQISNNPVLVCASNCHLLTNPQEKIEVFLDCSNCSSKISSYEWSIADCNSNTLMSCEVERTQFVSYNQSKFFYFTKDVRLLLPPYQGIFVTVHFKDASPTDAAMVIHYSRIPTTGICEVFPQIGYALLTDFNITCRNFSVSDGSELTFSMYSNTQNNFNKAVKLYKGAKSFVNAVKLQEGSVTDNNTIYILVKASLNIGTYVTVSSITQVLSPAESKDGISSIDLVTSIVGGDDKGDSDQVDDLLSAGNSDAAVQLIGIVTSTINTMSESEDKGLTERKSRVRSAIVTNLGRVNISDFETLTTLTAVLNDVTEVKTELTETAQNEATHLYDGMADSLDEMINNTYSKTQVTGTAVSIIQGVTGLLDIVTDSGKGRLINNTESPPQVIGSNAQNETIVEKVKNSTSILLNTLSKVSGSVLTQQFVNQPPAVIQTEAVTISVQKISPDRLAGKHLSPDNGLEDSNSFILFDKPLPMLNNDLGIKILGMKKNPFIWDSSVRDVNSEVLTIDLVSNDKSKVPVTNLTSPVQISLKSQDSVTHKKTSKFMNILKNKQMVEYDGTKSNVLTFNFTTQLEKTAVLKVTPVSNITRIKIAISDKGQLNLEDILMSGFFYPDEIHTQTQYTNFTLTSQNVSSILEDVNSGVLYFHHNMSSGGDEQTIYVGLTVDINDTETIVQLQSEDPECLGDDELVACTSVIEVPIIIQTNLLYCTYWDVTQQKWSNKGCEVSPYTSMSTLTCVCNHLTSFAGGMFVLPNFIDPIGDAELFLTFFDNPVVVTAVIVVWIIYFFLVHWARQADKGDVEKVGVLYCTDNDVTHIYNYLVCVVTGWWKDAGTTANVFIYIQGKQGASPRRKLSTSARLCFQTGYEDWFLITTEESLGDLFQVTFWHDNTGTSPHWYLSQTFIQDMHTGKSWTFIFNDWLAVDRGAFLRTTGTIEAVSPEELRFKQKHNFIVKTVQGFRDGHLWISVFSKRACSTFTRVQRLTCALSLLLTTMLTNIMFYGIPTDEPSDQVAGVGGIRISLTALVIGIQSSLIMFPVNLLVLQLFIRVKPKVEHLREKHGMRLEMRLAFKKMMILALRVKENIINMFKTVLEDRRECDMKMLISDLGCKTSTSDESSASSTNTVKLVRSRKSTEFLPWWFLYISWIVVIAICLVSSYFVMLYGLKYGYEKSVEWLVSFLTGFTQSAFVVQPVKVICIAIVVAVILKKTAEFEDFGPNVDLDIDEEYLCLTKDHRETHIPHCEPLSSKLLRQLKERLKLEWLMNATIRDIILYVIYLTVVMIVVHGQRDVNQAYMCTVAVEDILVNPGDNDEGDSLSLENIDNIEAFYQYLYDVAIPSLEDMSIADHDYATPGSSHYLVGPYRLRQLRVAKGTCPSGMKWLFNKMDMYHLECTGMYWLGDEDSKHYSQNWTVSTVDEQSPPTIWTYQSAWKLKTIPFTGNFATYSGGGYVLTMPTDSTLHEGIIKDVWNTDWIDERTRAIFLEFTLYNPNADLFSVVMIIFEFSNLGAVMAHHQIFTTKLFHYSTDMGIFVAVCEVSFLLFNIGFASIEYKRYKKIGRQEYFSDKWSYVELLQIGLSFSVIGLFFQRLVSVTSIMKDYRASEGHDYVSFYTAVSWDYILGYVMGFLICFLTLKFIKLLEFNKRMFMISDVFTKTKGTMLSFVITVVLFAVSYAHFANIAFGKVLKGYRSIFAGLMTLFNFALGVSDLPGLQSADRILGPAFFFLFIFIVQICFLQIFIAILNFGINESKVIFKKRKSRFDLLTYIGAKIKLVSNLK